MIKKDFVGIFELYNFKLYGYNQKNDPQFFSDISDNKKNCNITKPDNTQPNFDNDYASCDIITNNTNDIITNNTNDIKGVKFANELDLYTKSHTKLLIRDQFKLTGNEYYNDDYLTSLHNNINKSTTILQSFYKTKTGKILNNIVGNYYHKGAFLYKIYVKNNKNIIIFGDYHGSFHSFYRNMMRLHLVGALDMDTKKIHEDFILIFLGDIVDRGNYGVDILKFLFELFVVNNTENELKIIINRGNHEHISQQMKDGFYEELTTKFKELKSFKNFDHKIYDKENSCDMESLYCSFIKFMNISPSAILLINDECQKKYWLSHGGFPVGEASSENIEEPFEIGHDDIIFYESPNSKNSFDPKKYSIPHQIRWNDFMPHDMNVLEENKEILRSVLKIQDIPPNYIKNLVNLLNSYPRVNMQRGINLNNNHVKAFCEKNKIDFIIRGHQDICGNFCLFTDEGLNNMFDSKFAINKIKNVYLNTNIVKINDVIDLRNGPVGKIVMTKNYKNLDDNKMDLYPVITLSTNTDINRNLVHDSFGILRFIEEKQFENFEDLGDSLITIPLKPIPKTCDQKTNSINGGSFKKKYLKYKLKYLNFKKKYIR